MSVITYLRLDADYDPVFDPNVALTDLQAVEQAIKTRILLFEGEWFENLNEGTPMFQDILAHQANPANLANMELALTARISGTPYVAAVLNITITFNPVTRALSYSATVQSVFGQVKIDNFSVGAMASLG